MIKAKPIKGLQDAVNSEGFIIRVLRMEGIGLSEKDIYLEGTFDGEKIYCKTNNNILTLYFEDRLRTKELFLVRSDEAFYIKAHSKIIKYSYHDDLVENALDMLQCGKQFFGEIPASMRCNPDTFLNKLCEIF